MRSISKRLNIVFVVVVTLVLIASGALYFVVLTVLGVRLKQFARKAA